MMKTLELGVICGVIPAFYIVFSTEQLQALE